MKEKKEDIISKLLINNYDKYYHIAYSYTQNKNDAQDIVQEGAYKAIYNSEKLRQVKYALIAFSKASFSSSPSVAYASPFIISFM